jgi:hypothetical protein
MCTLFWMTISHPSHRTFKSFVHHDINAVGFKVYVMGPYSFARALPTIRANWQAYQDSRRFAQLFKSPNKTETPKEQRCERA